MPKPKTDKTKKEINGIIVNWDFKTNGKITQELVAKQINKTIRTVQRNWIEAKPLVKELNKKFKTSDYSNDNNEVEQDTIQDEKVSEIASNEVTETSDEYCSIECNGFRVRKEYEAIWKYMYNLNTERYFKCSAQDKFDYACNSIAKNYNYR